QLSIFFSNRNLHFIAISPGIIFANGFVYRNIWEMRYFFHYIFHLVLFYFHLHILTHMLYLTTTTFIKHIARCLHTMLTLLMQVNEFTASKHLIHPDSSYRRFFSRQYKSSKHWIAANFPAPIAFSCKVFYF